MELHLDEHKKRQGTFFEGINGVLPMLRLLRDNLPDGRSLEPKIKSLNELIADKAPKDVLGKVQIFLNIKFKSQM